MLSEEYEILIFVPSFELQTILSQTRDLLNKRLGRGPVVGIRAEQPKVPHSILTIARDFKMERRKYGQLPKRRIK